MVPITSAPRIYLYFQFWWLSFVSQAISRELWQVHLTSGSRTQGSTGILYLRLRNFFWKSQLEYFCKQSELPTLPTTVLRSEITYTISYFLDLSWPLLLPVAVLLYYNALNKSLNRRGHAMPTPLKWCSWMDELSTWILKSSYVVFFGCLQIFCG